MMLSAPGTIGRKSIRSVLILFSMMPERKIASWRWDWTVASAREERRVRNGRLDEIDLDKEVVLVLIL